MSLLTRHFTTAVIERFIKYRKNAQIIYTNDSGAEFTYPTQDAGRALDLARRNVALAVDTTITLKAHEGRNVIMGGAGSARTFTLPNCTGSGAIYRFTVGAVNTSNYLIKTSRGADTFDGLILNSDTDTSGAMRGWSPGATDDTITLNGSTSGGSSIGDWIEVRDIAANQWAVSGNTSATGAPITPFSDTVA